MAVDRQCGLSIPSEGLVRCQSVDQLLEDLCPLEVGLFGCVVLLTTEDRNELRSGLEEPTALTDRLIGAVELGGSSAVPVAQQAGVALGQQAGLPRLINSAK